MFMREKENEHYFTFIYTEGIQLERIQSEPFVKLITKIELFGLN